MYVFDTSAYLNGWHDHYPRSTFPSVWLMIEAALDDGRVVSPREAYVELLRKDDEVGEWAKARASRFIDPTAEVQRDAGLIYGDFPQGALRNQADPWIIAEAKSRSLTVVTYEGRTFSGVPTKNWHRSMPGICGRYSVPCVTLPEALGQLGGQF